MQTLETFINSLGSAQDSRMKDLHVQAVRSEVHPSLPQEIFGFPVYDFNQDGTLIDSTGETCSPITFAINRTLSDSDQVLTLITLTLSTIYRRPSTDHSSVKNIPLPTIGPANSESIERKAKNDAEHLIHRMTGEKSVRGLEAHFHEHGYNVILTLKQDLRPERPTWIGAMRLLASAYNTIPSVTDFIDRTVFMTFGGGFKIGAPDEVTRRYLEQRQVGMGTHYITTQSMRDSVLFGTSCTVTSADIDPAIHLIRPDRLRLGWIDGIPHATDEFTLQTWPLQHEDINIMRGIAQNQSLYGLSILEPLIPLLHRLLTTSRALEELSALPLSTPQPVLDELGQKLVFVDDLKKYTEERLRQTFQFSEAQFPLDRDNLYFPGWGHWIP